MKLLEKNKKNDKIPKIVIILLIVLMISSVFSVFTQGGNVNTGGKKFDVKVRVVLQGQEYPPQTQEVTENTTIHELLKNEMSVQFEQDGDVKSYQNVRNNFATQTYWQVFVNNKPEDDLMKELKEEDEVMLYYGKMINFFNLTVKFNMSGMVTNHTVMTSEGVTVNQILNNYNATLENNTLDCLMQFCNNVNNTWKVLVNNKTVGDYSQKLNEEDELMLDYGVE